MIVTESAKAQFKEIGGIIRYSLYGGGCSGLIGKWETVDKIDNKIDVIVWRACKPGTMGGEAAEQEDCPTVFIMDEFTLNYMKDATIDYTGGPFSPAFKIDVPSMGSCGCGESFMLTE
jgi:Fe-S cluster assembly iron-binding protein IscA